MISLSFTTILNATELRPDQRYCPDVSVECEAYYEGLSGNLKFIKITSVSEIQTLPEDATHYDNIPLEKIDPEDIKDITALAEEHAMSFCEQAMEPKDSYEGPMDEHY